MALLRIIFEVDTEQPLGPQLAPWRAYGMQAKPICALLKISRRHLQRLTSMSQIWERHRVRTEVLLPDTNEPPRTEACPLER